MKVSSFAGCLTAVLLASTVPATAQDRSWDTSFTFYLWAAETDTAITTALGTVESTLPFSNALENLDFAFMGALEARNGPWSLIGDFAYTDISFSSSTPGPAFGGVDADVKLQVLNAYGLYNVRSSGAWSIDLGAGARWFDADTTLTLLPGAAAGRSQRFSDSWIDPVIAARFTYEISDRWTAAGFVDFGGFRSDSESWQALITARFSVNDQWSITAAYRYLDIKHGPSDDEFKLTQSGPIFGVRYDF
ncbi:outer membrane beta-barrel protein [Pseudophaeobacter sp. EL27]|uniref:outer membrane beta-barrel protein n=1 Tax=Pseudophaeobacter sp. EL27 TaxID=2107580 RepID=UPI000EFD7827|nr:outer membrane beta-barrel protein [Pseudophaeobacter sp. EL27]